jgi:hypothetical protein
LSSPPDARTGSVDAGRRIVAAGARAGRRTGIGLINFMSLLPRVVAVVAALILKGVNKSSWPQVLIKKLVAWMRAVSWRILGQLVMASTKMARGELSLNPGPTD